MVFERKDVVTNKIVFDILGIHPGLNNHVLVVFGAGPDANRQLKVARTFRYFSPYSKFDIFTDSEQNVFIACESVQECIKMEGEMMMCDQRGSEDIIVFHRVKNLTPHPEEKDVVNTWRMGFFPLKKEGFEPL